MIRGAVATGCLFSLMAFASPLAAQTAAPTKPKVVATPEQLATSDVSLEAYRSKYLAKTGPITRAKLPSLVAKVHAAADAKAKPGTAPPDLFVIARDTSWAALGAINDADIEALAFLVLMQAAKSAQDDVRDVMEKVKAINETKKCQRDSSCRGGVRTKYERVTGKAAIDEILAADPKGLDELSESAALKLQKYLERLSRVSEAVSNVAQKVAATSNQLSSNLK